MPAKPTGAAPWGRTLPFVAWAWDSLPEWRASARRASSLKQQYALLMRAWQEWSQRFPIKARLMQATLPDPHSHDARGWIAALPFTTWAWDNTGWRNRAQWAKNDSQRWRLVWDAWYDWSHRFPTVVRLMAVLPETDSAGSWDNLTQLAEETIG
jgi:hypothetical protein